MFAQRTGLYPILIPSWTLQLLGEAIKSLPRADVKIATKIGKYAPGRLPHQSTCATPANTFQTLHTCCRMALLSNLCSRRLAV